ncbi:uncharacterized protein CIMG_04446 [Coccidioides immitis RS]|uniref:CENP-V/GFA domain-containing protein n=4 Tax=Coccidioides immitis TaxID=5501 RepID=J3KDI1_COCIM|nr:uncharacterized protein CIMG_04446 [Coccidioides immitis RS]KMP04587.1 hypothetical protein CIRG_04268 [Coccidioides immitis RMSCC 2394]KMU79430.1 hypothetical protein CISG_07861 [Coccidioides immitis RMSCC 3703]KMU90389.1 hypothetical protein CIHG_08199 [Coccidioides immitis H538.4]TPX21155.1 hypothetical protein DIZ76_015109 [Coccidioides immitis]EAS33422.3 hypothetical protein CIMG_04446 [Coccidioides immitis RS]
MSTIRGKCHCGQSEWSVKLADQEKSHILCHCDACKQINGGEFTLNQVIPQENFNLEKGNLSKYTYKGDSGNDVHCFFCPTCSTHVYHHQTVLGKYIVRTAALDGAKGWPVAAEIYCKDTSGWLPKISDNNFPAAPPA